MKKPVLGYIKSILLVILVGSLPIISLWHTNIGEFPSYYLITVLIISLAVSLMLHLIILLIFKEPGRATMLSLGINIYLFTFGHIYNLIGNRILLGIEVGFLKLFVLWSFILIFYCYLILKAKKIDRSIFTPITVILLAIIIFNLYPIMTYEMQLESKGKTDIRPDISLATEVENLPDIYYIVLDSYTDNNVLTSLIGYDNSSFLNELSDRGFIIPECAFSNYNVTSKTIASVLNYEYLSSDGSNTDEEDSPSAVNINLIKDSKVQKTFSELGYQFVSGRGFTPYLDIERSDIIWNYSLDQKGRDDLAWRQFLNLYLNTTAFRFVTELSQRGQLAFLDIPYWLLNEDGKNSYLDTATLWYEQNLYMFDSIKTIPALNGNYLIYAHIIAPHGPYVFYPDGKFRYPLDTNDEKALYRDAVIYTNERILGVIDTLLLQSEVPPIIIIQGDHGIHKMTKGLDKHKILSAYYLPGKINMPVYDTITPVNNFRLIIRNYFDPSMELLPDIVHLAGKNNNPVEASCGLD